LDSKLREVPKPDLSSLRINRDDDDSPRTGLRVVLFGTALVVLVGVLLIGYRLWASSTIPEVEVTRSTIESGSSGLEVLTATGYVVAHRKAAVSPKISGRLEYLGVDTGSHVRAGEIIARLEHRDLDAQLADAKGSLSNWRATQSQSEAELEQARAQLAQSQANRQKSKLDLERQSRLLKDGVVSKSDFDNATAQAEVDEANVRAAQALIRAGQFKVESAAAQIASAEARITMMQAQIEYANIRAPFDGIVISKDAEVGETVAPAIFGGSSTRGSVVTIVDPDTLEVEADITEAYIGKITMGLPAEVTLDALGAEKLPAETYKIVPTADRQKSTVKVKVRFEKVDARILPDMSAKITFIQKDAQAEGNQAARVTVPKSALQQRDGKTIVLVLSGDRMQSQVVTIGSEFGDRVEIKQGLAGGETLVLKGGENLSEGARVKVKPAS
jgi:RND family efflux transporter MFP subunit